MSYQILIEEGQKFSSEARYEEAIRCYREAIKINPNLADAYYFMGYTYSLLGKPFEGIELCDKAIECEPECAEAYVNKGFILGTILKKEEEAIKCYDEAIRINPNLAPVYCNKAMSLSALKRYEEALNSSNKAIEIKSDFAEAWFYKSVALYNLGDTEYLSSYAKAVELNPLLGESPIFEQVEQE
jgi:tetratricopeptide (TPR) repeat protein